MNGSLTSLVLVLVLPTLLGCEVWGRELVGKHPPDFVGTPMCMPAVECEPLPSLSPLQPAPAPSNSPSQCKTNTGSCAAPRPIPPGGAPNEPQLSTACDLQVSAQEFTARVRTLSCVSAQVVLPSAVPSVELRDLTANLTNLVFVAEQPVVLELSHALLTQTSIELRGPITLRLTRKSELRDTQINASGGVGASVELSESYGESFSTVGLAGRLRVVRSNLRLSRFFAGSVELETTTFSDLDIAADQLVVADVRGKRVHLEVGVATISSADLERLSLQKCGSMLVTTSSVRESNLDACTDKLRVDRSVVNNSKVVGRLESHITIWQANTFGAGAETELQSWTDSVFNNRFCSSLRRLTLSRPSTLSCNDCTQSAPGSSELFCSLASDDVVLDSEDAFDALELRNPNCVALDQPFACDPEPIDENPF